MTLSLTPAEAELKIQQVDEAMITARTLAGKILDTTQTMTASSWLGGKAHTFNGIMSQHNDDFNTVITALTQVAEKGKSDIRTIVTHDTD
ncbi:MAG TPA: hypothetical protein VJ777_14170 [Mycobacterium sp.]|nr:hypothetical protein [Mycobacterium sp.]